MKYARFRDNTNETEIDVYDALPNEWVSRISGLVISNFRKASSSVLYVEGFRPVIEGTLAADHIYSGIEYDMGAKAFRRGQIFLYEGMTLIDYKKDKAREICSLLENKINLTNEALATYTEGGAASVFAQGIRSTARAKRSQVLNLIKNATSILEINAIMDTARTHIDSIDVYDIVDDYFDNNLSLNPPVKSTTRTIEREDQPEQIKVINQDNELLTPVKPIQLLRRLREYIRVLKARFKLWLSHFSQIK